MCPHESTRQPFKMDSGGHAGLDPVDDRLVEQDDRVHLLQVRGTNSFCRSRTRVPLRSGYVLLSRILGLKYIRKPS